MNPDSPEILPALPSDAIPAHLEGLVETAKDYARGAKAPATQRAYAADWRHYTAWCRRHDLDPLPPDPQTVGLYLAALASDAAGKEPKGVRTIERRLSAIAWHCTQHGQPLDRADRHIAEVMSGIRRRHGKPPDQKEAVLTAELVRMIATLGHDLRDLRDRAILMLGFAGGLRRSEIVSLDCGPDQTVDGAGWIQFLEDGIVIRVRGKTGWREVEVGRGSSDSHLPGCGRENLARLCPHRSRPAVPVDRRRQKGRFRPAHRQARRPASEADGARGWHPD